MLPKLGKPLPPVKEVARPTKQEVDLLVSLWDVYAPAKYRGMLSALPLGTDAPKVRWFYDAERKAYVSKAGAELGAKELRQAWIVFHRNMNKRKADNV